MNKGGRPTDHTTDLAAAICGGLSLGQSLKRVTSGDGMPDPSTVYDWLRKHPEFAEMYTRAKEDASDLMAEEIIEIADSDPGMTPKGETDKGAVDHRRLRVEARKWCAAKLKPRKYGEKIQQEISGKLTMEDLLTETTDRERERDKAK